MSGYSCVNTETENIFVSLLYLNNFYSLHVWDLLLRLKSINANLHLLKGSPFSNNLRKLSAGSTVPISVTVL